MSKELAVSNTEAVVGSFTQKELDTMKATIAVGTTNEQFALFVQTCVSSGLNPFLNQIYCIVYQGQKGPVMSMQIAVEGIVALAKKHPQYKGFIASEIKEQDEFEIDMVTGEPIHKIKGLGNRGKTLGAYCVAYREGMPNISVVVDLDQVAHLINSSIANTKKMWADYRDDMLVKHAIKRAFKRQFGIEVAEDETGGNSNPTNNVENIADYRKDVTPEKDGWSGEQEAPEGAAQQLPKRERRNVQDADIDPTPTNEPVDPTKVEAARNMMIKNFELLGIEKKQRGAYIVEKLEVPAEKHESFVPSFGQMQKLNKTMEEQIKKNLLPDDLE